MDHFSRLPDHLHVFILLKLGTKEAVKTSGLSRQWRRIWIQVPVLNFDGVDCGVTRDALAAYQAHGEGDIQSLTVSPNANELNAEDTTAWTSIAAPLLSGTLYLDNRRTVTPERLGVFLNDDGGEVRRTGTFHLPCFERATELWLDVGFLGLSLPPVGVFDALGVLWLANFWCPGEFSISHAILPSLQELTISRVRGLAVLTVNSESLHYLHLSSSPELQNLSILAPQLISLEVASCLYVPASVANVVAENLKILRWEVQCRPELAEMSSLLQLQAPAIDTFWSELVCSEFLSCFSSIYHLELQISLGMEMNGLALWMENITIPSVTVLSLFLETNGHNFEGRVLQLLLNCVVIRELHLSFQSRDEVQGYCSDDCICHSEPVIWGAKIIPVRGLRKITIYNFNGAPREVNFLDELVRRALGLDTLRIISNVDDPCLEGIEEISPAGCKIYVQWAASATRSSSC